MNGMINTISRLKELTRCCHFDSQDDNEEKTHVTHLLYVFSSGTTWFTMWYHVVYHMVYHVVNHMVVPDYHMVVPDYHMVVPDYHMVVSDYHMVVSDYHMVYHMVPCGTTGENIQKVGNMSPLLIIILTVEATTTSDFL